MSLIDSARKLAVEVQVYMSHARPFREERERLRSYAESVLVDCQRAEQREPPHCPTCGCGEKS